MRSGWYILLVFLAVSCANRVTPTGGDKDVTPPKLLSAEPENGTVDFKAKEIRLEFDEYVQLNDLQAQLFVSPLTSSMPKVTVGKKALVVEVPDSLEPNTTYTINFGKAIADVHESNPLEDFRYVFSTGSFIDSLTLSGEVRNAGDLEGAKGITVMVYRKTAVMDDSLPFKERPLYFSRTNDKGIFRIFNMRAGEYQVYAVEDKNGNFKCDSPSDELFGFLPSSVTLPGDSIISMKVWQEYPEKARVTKMMKLNRRSAAVAFNKPGTDYRLMTINGVMVNDSAIRRSSLGDTLTWFAMNNEDSMILLAAVDTLVLDTARVSLLTEKGVKESPLKNRWFTRNTPLQNGPSGKVVLQSAHPLGKDSIFVLFQEDSSKAVKLPLNVTDARLGLTELMYPWKETSTYTLKLIPEETKDIFGASADTTVIRFKVPDEQSTASLSLKAEGLQSGSSYLVQLLSEKSDIIKSWVITGDTTINCKYLQSVTARIKVINDRNADGRWTPGRYLTKQLPEPVWFHADPVTLRANWELELVVRPEFKK